MSSNQHHGHQDPDAPYRDASSTPVSLPGYVDASSLPVSLPGYADASNVSSGEKLETDGDASVCSSTTTPSVSNTASSHSLFYDAQEHQGTEGIAEDVAMKRNGQQAPSNGNQQPLQDDRHVYFELEKQVGAQQEDSAAEEKARPQKTKTDFQGKTITKAKVNVAALRAQIFEGSNPDPLNQGGETPDGAKQGEEEEEEEAIYDVPPALRTNNTSLTEPDTGSSAHKKHHQESIYEFSFSDSDQQTQSLENSLDGSGIYEIAGSAIKRQQPPPSEAKGSNLTAPPHTDLGGSGGFPSCKQGTVRQEALPGVAPSQEEISSEYNRLQFGRSAERKASTPEEAGYHSLSRSAGSAGPPRDPSTNEPLYEIPETLGSGNRHSWHSEEWSDGSWGSSEFDYDEDEEGYLGGPDLPAPSKPLPRKPRHNESDSLQRIPALLNKLKHNVSKATVYEDSDAVCLPVTINPSKHPPPALPPPPPGLSDSQKKCRCVIDLTISSERSYIESLERILQDYERMIVDAIPSPKSSIRIVMREAREILNHHKMFQIQLSDTVNNWDTEEKIGDIFTASFSKSMLVDAYSMYVNNFAAGMDEIRTAQQNKPNFEEFLKMKEKVSYDRLSVFGLMVKPVQRFPQFIMLLQDLIKYMPSTHHDRRALQLAVTELENVTHKLNERKRLSEQYFQAKQTMQLLPRQLPSHILSSRNMDKPRRLIRFDNFDQIDGEMENMKSSSRRLILMDDMLVCVKVGLKDQDGFMMERYRLKWAVRLCDVELKDTANTPDMRNVLKMDPKRLHVLASQLEKPSEDPFHLYADLRDMLHDLTVFGNITSLMPTLRRNYQGYNMSEELFHEVTADLQRMIQIKDEQLRLVNSCSIILVDNSKADKPHYVMQTATAATKTGWCVDFNMAKLAIEKQNRPGWDRSPMAGEEELEPVPAFFMKCVAVDVPRHYTKVKCAIPVFMPSAPQVMGLGIQHLWVCTSNASRGQVSVVSLHNMRPALTEAFKAGDSELLCCEVVPGCGQDTDVAKFLFSQDTVWMSDSHNQIVVFPLSSGGGSTATRDPLSVVRVPGQVTSIKFVDERLFCGLDDGAVLVYSRNDVGEWCMKAGRTLQLGRGPIRCQLVVDDDLWIACGHKVHVVEIDSLKILNVHKLSNDHTESILQMVRSGVGVWVAFHTCAAVRLFHLETMDCLQEMSVANTVNRVLAEKSGHSAHRDCVVTCLAASTGLLWIGTSVGLILTLPLPRLSDGVPLYSGRPSVAFHAHRSPVRFIIPVYTSSSILELHKNSSLRSNLRARPSLRNQKRELLETSEAMEDKLLSSGTELEASLPRHSQPADRAGDSRAGVDDLRPPLPAQAPTRMGDPVLRSQAGRKFFSLKRNRSLKRQAAAAKGRNPVSRGKNRTLSFRSELANRIKSTTLGRFQAQSMVDLRSDDTLEVEMLYENLLDTGDISEEDGNDDNTSVCSFDDLSVMSDSALSASDLRALPAGNNISSSSSLRRGKSKPVDSLDLAGLNGRDRGSVVAHPAFAAKSSGGGLSDSTSSAENATLVADSSKTSTSTAAKRKSIQDNPLPPLPPPRSQSTENETSTSTRPKSVLLPPRSTESTENQRPKSVQDNPLPLPPRSKPGVDLAGVSRQSPRREALHSPRTATIRANTMRKTTTSNAVMVLSGGDGYWDMHQGGNFSKNEDASLLFWIYKF